MSTSGPRRDLLEAVHSFPGDYTLKAFGPHEQTFVDAVTAVAVAAHRGTDEPQVSARSSAKGNHMCVTIVVCVDDADGVYALYDAVQAIAGLRMVL